MKRKKGSVEELETLHCRYCQYETTDLDDLDDHIISHADEELEFQTTEVKAKRICSEEIEEREELRSTGIQEDFDSEETTHFCPYCPYQTKRKNCMPKHLLNHSSKYDVVMYKCSQCSYETKRKCDMPKHLLSHCSNVEMYGCPDCPYVTKRKNDLPKHLLCHKRPEETQIFRCDQCEYGTKRKGDLNKHKLTHTYNKAVFSCTECSYSSKRQNDLNKHMLVHCDKHICGVFKCLKCNYATDKTNKFAKHVISNCTICDNVISVYPEDPMVAVQEYVIVDGNNVSYQVDDSGIEYVAVQSDESEENVDYELPKNHDDFALINADNKEISDTNVHTENFQDNHKLERTNANKGQANESCQQHQAKVIVLSEYNEGGVFSNEDSES